jgi:hypothetical protein
VDATSPKRSWWYSWWFAAIAILLAVGGLAWAVFLLAQAIAPSVT